MSEHGSVLHHSNPTALDEATISRQQNESFESQVTTKLADIHEHMQKSNVQLEANLPTVLRQIVREELEHASLQSQQRNEHSRGDEMVLTETREQRPDTEKMALQDQAKVQQGQIASLMTELATRKGTWEKEKEHLERQVTNSNMDLVRKNKEARKLHAIILQTSQDSSEVSDEDITARFGNLNYGILHFVNKHFAGMGAKTSLKKLNSLSKDDRMFYLRAKLADGIYDEFFHPSVKLFGLDEMREKAQLELEETLTEQDVPASDVESWRVKTVKVCRALKLKKASWHYQRLSDDLCNQYKECWAASDRRAAGDDMDELCSKAFNLALMLRESTSKFEWAQSEEPGSIPPNDMELIGPYNSKTSTARELKLVRVMFGPLWKIVDGERITLRKGEVLNGDGSSSS